MRFVKKSESVAVADEEDVDFIFMILHCHGVSPFGVQGIVSGGM